jgi:hypothetical protein
MVGWSCILRLVQILPLKEYQSSTGIYLQGVQALGVWSASHSHLAKRELFKDLNLL